MSKHLSGSRVGWLLLVCLGGIATESRADFVNGGFEQGMFGSIPGWDGLGDFGATTANLDGLGIAPTAGTQYGFLTNIGVFGAQPTAVVESFLGLPAGILAAFGINAVNGSAIRQSVALIPEDIISFDFNFVTAELGDPGFLDLAIVLALSDGSGNGSLFALADPTIALLPTSDPNFFQTGWISTSFATSDIFDFVAGPYTIGFAIFNVGDADPAFPSYLFLDQVALTSVPEPGAAMGLAIGLVGLGGAGVARRLGRRGVARLSA